MKTLIVTGAVVSERPSDGTRHLTISSQTESIILEFSQERWEGLSETAKWFHEQAVKDLIATYNKENESNVQVPEVPELGTHAEEDRR